VKRYWRKSINFGSVSEASVHNLLVSLILGLCDVRQHIIVVNMFGGNLLASWQPKSWKNKRKRPLTRLALQRHTLSYLLPSTQPHLLIAH
jgi:hypothetical protein